MLTCCPVTLNLELCLICQELAPDEIRPGSSGGRYGPPGMDLENLEEFAHTPAPQVSPRTSVYEDEDTA